MYDVLIVLSLFSDKNTISQVSLLTNSLFLYSYCPLVREFRRLDMYDPVQFEFPLFGDENYDFTGQSRYFFFFTFVMLLSSVILLGLAGTNVHLQLYI